MLKWCRCWSASSSTTTSQWGTSSKVFRYRSASWSWYAVSSTFALKLRITPVPQCVCSDWVQLALLEHFHSRPLSVLCCEKKEAVQNLLQLSHQDLERVRQLPSFKRCNTHNCPITIFSNKKHFECSVTGEFPSDMWRSWTNRNKSVCLQMTVIWRFVLLFFFFLLLSQRWQSIMDTLGPKTTVSVFRMCVWSWLRNFTNTTKTTTLSWGASTLWPAHYPDTLWENRQETWCFLSNFTKCTYIYIFCIIYWMTDVCVADQRASFNMSGEQCVGEWGLSIRPEAFKVSS